MGTKVKYVLDLSRDESYVIDSGSSEQTYDYESLINKPQINDVTLVGNNTWEDLDLNALTNFEIENMLT